MIDVSLRCSASIPATASMPPRLADHTVEHMFNCMNNPRRRARPAEDDRAPKLADLFRLLGDPTRLRIVIACREEPMAVGAIAEGLGLSLSLVSHHLRLLRAARLVRGLREGRQVFYQVADHHVRGMISDMLEHIAEEAD